MLIQSLLELVNQPRYLIPVEQFKLDIRYIYVLYGGSL